MQPEAGERKRMQNSSN
nr:unnamed protein product [Callosobruchus chinensis]